MQNLNNIEPIQMIINEIITSFETENIIKPDNMMIAKLILDLHLTKFKNMQNDITQVSTELENNDFYVQQYLFNMKLRGCTNGSIKSYMFELKAFLAHIDKNIRDITYQDIQKYLAYGKINRRWKDRTYNVKLIIIRTFFAFLYEEDLIKENPGKKLHETKVEHRIGVTINAYQREEIKCACIDEREEALCEMLYSTGARISEICALNIADIDFTNMSAIIYGKGRKEREIYFNAPTKLHLEKYIESRNDDNPALFVSMRKPHNRMTTSSARVILKNIKLRNNDTVNIKLTPHVFRRTVGTDMINKGAPLEIVAEKLGHAKMDTTRQCYASISRNTVRIAHNKYVG